MNLAPVISFQILLYSERNPFDFPFLEDIAGNDSSIMPVTINHLLIRGIQDRQIIMLVLHLKLLQTQ